MLWVGGRLLFFIYYTIEGAAPSEWRVYFDTVIFILFSEDVGVQIGS